MIDLSMCVPAVRINLDNGVYVFEKESATGKTRLGKLLEMISSDMPVDYVTYATKDRLLKVLSDPEKQLVLIDRYDLYSDIGTKEIREFGKRGIALVDMKYPKGIGGRYCTIKLSMDEVTVS